ncbi:hypothetical protein ACQPZJ_17620 [Actinoplanes sp. CA-054009]
MDGVLPLLTAALGALIAFAGVWLTQRRMDHRSLQERREQRLLPAYLRYHTSLREWVRVIESHARTGATADLQEQMREAFEQAKLAGYEMDLMAPPEIARGAERVLDRLLELSELLGYPLRLSALEPRSEPYSRDEIRGALIAISDSRLALMVRMQQDLGLRSKRDSSMGTRDEHRMLRP